MKSYLVINYKIRKNNLKFVYFMVMYISQLNCVHFDFKNTNEINFIWI